MKNFLSLINTGFLLWDGGMNTLRGLEGENPGISAKILLEEPSLMKKIHQDFLEGGSMGVTTATCEGNRFTLRKLGLGDRVGRVNRTGAEVAKDACGGSAFVSGAVGPTGTLLKPFGKLDFLEAVEIFQEQMAALVAGGVDAIQIESMEDIREIKAAMLAARKISSIPLIVMMRLGEEMGTSTGTTVESFGTVAHAMGADLIGITSSSGFTNLFSMVSRLASVTDRPIIVKGDEVTLSLIAGSDSAVHGDFASRTYDLLAMGVRVIAGDRGVTPSHIRQARKDLPFKTSRGIEILPTPERSIPLPEGLAVASRSRVVRISDGGPVRIVGERINPTGKKNLIADLREGKMDHVSSLAREQEKCGAHILDVNVGVPELNEESLMEDAVYAANMSSSLPLMIDSMNGVAIEKGILAVDGLAIINSATGDRKRLELLLPLVKESGSPLICLLLDGQGIPDTAKGRLKIARKIVREAERAGIKRSSLIMDCLVTSLGRSHRAALCTLETVEIVRKDLGLPVILGISNVSFGIPARSLINRAFLAMAVSRGLSMAMLNPLEEGLVESLYGCELLTGRNLEKEGREYDLPD